MCDLCPHACRIDQGKCGICQVRQNVAGKLYSLNYGQVSSLALDPIEKKPFNRFRPGSFVLSLGSWGCNLACGFCQNWQISQQKPAVQQFTAQGLVEMALAMKVRGNIGLAYTYSEPLVCYEFVKDCAVLAKEAGLANVLVSNGYINKEPLLALAPLLDAANIDLKSFQPAYYRTVCKGDLAPVLQTIAILKDYCHVEVSTLIVPGYNDSAEEMGQIASWLADLDVGLPLHINRYFPAYQLNIPPTSQEKIYELKKIAGSFLTNVYAGNL